MKTQTKANLPQKDDGKERQEEYRTPIPFSTHTHTHLSCLYTDHRGTCPSCGKNDHQLSPPWSFFLCAPRPSALLNQQRHILHWTEPFCSSIGLLFSARHLCLLRSPCLLKVLPHSLLPCIPPVLVKLLQLLLFHCRAPGVQFPPASVYCQTTSAPEPSSAILTLHSTNLLIHWIIPQKYTCGMLCHSSS